MAGAQWARSFAGCVTPARAANGPKAFRARQHHRQIATRILVTVRMCDSGIQAFALSSVSMLGCSRKFIDPWSRASPEHAVAPDQAVVAQRREREEVDVNGG